MKKKTHISIEETLLIEAKDHIPNLSKFVEECLSVYLDLNNSMTGELAELELKQLNRKIDQLKLKRYYLSEQTISNKNSERRWVEEQNKRWRKIWADYRKYKIYDNYDMEKAEELLDKNEEELITMMDKLLEYRREISLMDCEEWNGALATYNKLL